jgi:HTH-type transcriptional regulator, sugar sensing transcriptional regulator
MSNQILIEGLKRMGLSEYEAKCYLALFERESLSVGEISKLTGIARPNAYDAMERLLIKGLSISVVGKMKRYSVAAPRLLRDKALEIVDNNLEMEMENIEKKKKEIVNKGEIIREDIGNIINKLELFYKKNRTNGTSLDYTEIIKNPNQIHHNHIRLCSEAQKEILSFVKPPFAFTTKKGRKEQVTPQDDAIKRGVKIKTIHEIPTDETEKAPFFKRLCDELPSEGEEIRVIDNLPTKLLIIDEKVALMTIGDLTAGRFGLTSIVARDPGLAKALKLSFESVWKEAKDYYILNNRKYYLSKNGKEKKK